MLKYRLAPILAQSAEEQQLIYDLYDQFIKDIQERPLATPPRKLQWWETIPAWVLILTGLLLFTAVVTPIAMYVIGSNKPALKVYFEHLPVVKLGDTVHFENLSAHFDTSSCVFSWYLIDPKTGKAEAEQLEGEGFHWNLIIDSIGADHQKEVHLICDNPASIERDTHVSTLTILCKDFPDVGKILAPERAKVSELVFFDIEDSTRISGIKGLNIEKEEDLNYYWDFGDQQVSRDRSPQYRYRESGVYTVNLRVERPNQAGFCIKEQSHQIIIGGEKAYLQAKVLAKDPLNIILQFGVGTWIVLAFLAIGLTYFWVRWLTQKKPETKEEKQTIALPTLAKNTDRAPYFIPFRSQYSLIRVEPALYQLADTLRQRQEGLRLVLDMPNTIQQTIERGGFPKVAYRRNTQPTDYLVLLDEQAPNSHFARLYDYLIDFLVDSDVHITTFRYKTSFHRFWNKAYPDGITMPQLQRLYPHFRLIIIGDAHDLLNPLAKKKAALKPSLVYDFSYWKSRLLLTPLPQVSWTYREGVLYELFAIFTGNIAGLQSAMNYLESQNLDDETPNPDYETWKRINSPKELHPDVNYRRWRKPTDFKDYLANRPDLYTWFCALAVYPKATWEITLAIGKALYPKGVRVTFDNLLILARIPLLQSGNWSPRLRKALLEEIDPEMEQLAREAVKEELEAIAPLVKNSHAGLDLQSHLAIQTFAIDPKDENNQAILSWMLQQNMLNKKQIFDLNNSLQKNWQPPIQAEQNVVSKANFVSSSAPNIQTFLQQEQEEEPEMMEERLWRIRVTPDLLSALALSFAFLLLCAAVFWLDGTETFYQAFFKNKPTTFIEGEDRQLGNYFFIRENVVVDSAVIFNNKAVNIWEQRLERMNLSSDDERTTFQVADPMPWLEKAMTYRTEDYPLAINNHFKTRYNLGIEKYHDYLHTIDDKPDETLLSFAQQDFRNSMVKDSSNFDALHAIGLTHFYYQNMDSAALYYEQLVKAFFFDTLSLSPNLQTLYENHLYEEQQRQEISMSSNISIQQTNNNEFEVPQPIDIQSTKFLYFKGRILDEDSDEGIIGANIFFLNHKTTSGGDGYYTLKIEGDFGDPGLTLKVSKQGFEDVEQFIKLDYGRMRINEVLMQRKPEVSIPSKKDYPIRDKLPIRNERQIFERTGRIGLRLGKQVITEAIYNNIELDAGTGTYRVQKDGKFGYMDKDGKIIIPLEYNYLDFYSEGLIRAEKQLWGYLDRRGNTKIPFKFEEAENFAKNAARVVTRTKNVRKEFMIDKTGTCIANCGEDRK